MSNNVSLAQSIGSTFKDGISPRTRRYGFSPGLFETQYTVEVFHSGQQNMLLPQGEMIRFDTVPLKQDDFDIHKEDWVKTIIVEHPAQEFVENVKRAAARFGFVELEMLTLLSDEDAEQTFNTVHAHREIACPDGLRYCGTCRIKDLEAQEKSYAEGSTAEGLRLRLLESYVAANTFRRERWVQILKDLRSGLVTMDEGEKHIRRNLHEVDPDLVAANAAKNFGEAGAAATLAGMQAIADKMPQAGAGVEAILAQMARTQEQQGAILAQLVANQGGSVSASTTDAKIDKRSKEYRDAHKSNSDSGNESGS